MKNQVLSIEQMQRLKDLGVDIQPTGTCLMYTSDSSDKYYLKYGESTCEDDVKAFTLQDIIELLPKEIDGTYLSLELDYCRIDYYMDYYERISWKSVDFNIEEIMDGVYEMLLWVIENGYLKTK